MDSGKWRNGSQAQAQGKVTHLTIEILVLFVLACFAPFKYIIKRTFYFLLLVPNLVKRPYKKEIIWKISSY